MIFPSFADFVQKHFWLGFQAVLGGSATADGRICGDYARIAAMSGWTPMMFMTRVRL